MSVIVVMRAVDGLVVGLGESSTRVASLEAEVRRLVPLGQDAGLLMYGPGTVVLNAVVSLVEEERQTGIGTFEQTEQRVAGTLERHYGLAQGAPGQAEWQPRQVAEAIIIGCDRANDNRLRVTSCSSQGRFSLVESQQDYLFRVPDPSISQWHILQLVSRRLYFTRIGLRNLLHLAAFLLEKTAPPGQLMTLATVTQREGFKLVPSSRVRALLENNEVRFQKFQRMYQEGLSLS
ncbi:MAG: hypothetical protein M1358_21835 [Chloroflexi bacterium]|nr:hypothetical protein [Chloroflexota bacterium]